MSSLEKAIAFLDEVGVEWLHEHTSYKKVIGVIMTFTGTTQTSDRRGDYA